MKNQDIGLLLKLVLIEGALTDGDSQQKNESTSSFDWEDWEDSVEMNTSREVLGDRDVMNSINYSQKVEHKELYSVRSLSRLTGISKSQVSLSLQRMYDVGLAARDRKKGYPKANTKALYEFIIYGLRYVFPAKPAELTRGIATSIGAPVLANKLMTAGEIIPVWPDAKGSTKGMAVEPLFKSVTYAVRRDHKMYAMLALIDAIRIGQPRERKYAEGLLADYLGVKR